MGEDKRKTVKAVIEVDDEVGLEQVDGGNGDKLTSLGTQRSK